MLFISCQVAWEGLVFRGVQLYVTKPLGLLYLYEIVLVSEPPNVPCFHTYIVPDSHMFLYGVRTVSDV